MARKTKAVSPLVASILLTLIAIAAFAAIFFWMRGMIAEPDEKFGKPLEATCQQISMTANYDGTSRIEISNTGNVPVLGISVKVESGKKITSKKIVKPIDGVIEIGEVESLDVSGISDFNSGSKRTIAPIIQGRGTKSGKMKRYVCNNQGLSV